jgi:hypothetical protein
MAAVALAVGFEITMIIRARHGNLISEKLTSGPVERSDMIFQTMMSLQQMLYEK